MNNEAIVNSIKTLCKNKNMSAGQLEKEIGLSQGLISKWQRTMPSLDKIIDIADYFHRSLDEVIGRGLDINDKFLEKLYIETTNNTMKWHLNSIQGDRKIILPHRDDLYDEDIYTEIAYYTEFNESYFAINCFCKYRQTINPVELDFYIKPDEKSRIVYQEYSTEELKPLWVAIIKSLDDEAPDEIKTENIKQQFINDKQHNIIIDKNDNESMSFYNRILEYYNAFNKPEFIDLYEKLTSPQYTEMITKFYELTNSSNENVE